MNKHWIAACLVTPVLAIVGYFSVDLWVAEQPHPAKADTAYPLVAGSNCRYSSGVCQFKNNEMIVNIRITKQEVFLESNHPLSGAEIKINSTDSLIDTDYPKLTLKSQTPVKWSVVLPYTVTKNDQLNLVIAAKKSLYYGQTQLTFLHKETLFSNSSN